MKLNKTINLYRLLILIVFSLTLNIPGKCQFGGASYCNKNVNYTGWTDHYNDIKRATFKYRVPDWGICTGVLVNRNVSEDNLGQYFVSAWHCFLADPLHLENAVWENIDDSKTSIDNVEFYFNYQSKDDKNVSVPLDNQGLANSQSNPGFINNGYRYKHSSRIKLIKRLRIAEGDFVLCEILDPIPPHFNVFYAGWTPILAPGLNPPYVGIHHPKGDIKKISRTPFIINKSFKVTQGCRVVTKVIDFLFGWIWKRKYSTEVICNYIDNPVYFIPFWMEGTTQGGSSGSGLFNHSNRLVGNLRFGFAGCDVPTTDTYGKFKNNYLFAPIKNTLNPPAGGNTWWIDQVGVPGRQRECYDNLLNLKGIYWPANEYQQDNHIVLNAKNNITFDDVTVIAGADFTFNAPNISSTNITVINPGDAKFNSGGAPCSFKSSKTYSAPLAQMLNNVSVPKNKKFDISEHIPGVSSNALAPDNYLAIFPNPLREEILSVRYKITESVNSKIVVSDALGNTIFSTAERPTAAGMNEELLFLGDLKNGVYFITLIYNSSSLVQKLVINR